MTIMAKIKSKRPTDNRKGLPPIVEEASNILTDQKAKAMPGVRKDLNFKVDPLFKTKFKKYAVNNDMSMVELLMACFEYYEVNHR